MAQEPENLILVPFWNQKDIEPPKIQSMKLACNSRNNLSVRKVAAFRQLLTEIVTKLGRMKLLNKEAAVLSRMVYRMKRVFRQDKGFKNLMMLLKTLKSYLAMDMAGAMTSLHECCYETNCPSLETVEWALVCIMRITALFNRAHNLAEKASISFRERVTTGMHWKIASLCLAILSRIWVLTEYFLRKWCVWYSKIKSFSPQLASSGVEWLPKDFHLPEDLVAWLGNPPYLAEPSRPGSLQMSSGSSTTAVPLAEENRPTEERLEQQFEERIAKASTSQLNDMLRNVSALEIQDDIGEAVMRDDDVPTKGMKRKERFREKIGLKKKRKKI